MSVPPVHVVLEVGDHLEVDQVTRYHRSWSGDSLADNLTVTSRGQGLGHQLVHGGHGDTGPGPG